MNTIKHLLSLSSATILTLGLFGCGSDKQKASPSKPAANAWSVGEMFFVRKNEIQPQSLKAAEQNMTAYELSDILRFPEIERQSGVRLRVAAKCTHDSHRLEIHDFEEPMQSEYSIFELLPKEAIFNSFATIEKPVRCEFDFIARNSNGDTHRFSLRSSPILGKSVENAMIIYESGRPLVATGDYIEIKNTKLAQYQMRIPTHTRTASSYDFECTYTSARIENPPIGVRFDAFLFTDSAIEPIGSNIRSEAQLCRIFALSEKKRILALSPVFILRTEAATPVVTPKTALGGFQQKPSGRVSVLSVSLKNTSKNVMHLALNEAHLLEAIVVTDNMASYRTVNYTGHRVLLPTPVTIGGELAQKRTGDELRFSIKAGEAVQITLYAPLDRIYSPRDPHQKTLHGIYLRPLRTEGIYLSILATLDAPTDQLHTLGEVAVSGPFENYLYNVRAINNGTTILASPHEAPRVQSWANDWAFFALK